MQEDSMDGWMKEGRLPLLLVDWRLIVDDRQPESMSA